MVPTTKPLSSGRRESFGVLILLGTTVVWGTTFLVMAKALTSFTVGWLMAVRFALAALCLAPFALRQPSRLRRALWPGTLIGVLAFVGFTLQVDSLRYTTQAHCAFGTSLITVFVPLLGALVLGRRLLPSTWLALVCALLGMAGLVGGELLLPVPAAGALTPQGMLVGDLLAVASALGFAAQILLIERVAGRAPLLELVFVQVVCVCLLSLVTALASGEPWPTPTPSSLWSMAYLGVIATAGCLLGQMFGQARTSATRAAFIYALEPTFAASLAWAFDGEALGAVELCGGALLTLAAAVAERPSPRLGRAKKPPPAPPPAAHPPGAHDGGQAPRPPADG
ncbi:MAG: DMT family transporter [Hymenobacter sp.]|nr:MAG: DMT family transporter [Hymenobacter sp.]